MPKQLRYLLMTAADTYYLDLLHCFCTSLYSTYVIVQYFGLARLDAAKCFFLV